MIADVLHAQPGGLIRYVITDPGYPDPFASRAVGAVQPRSIVQLAPDVQIPQAVQYSAGVDHQAQKATTVSITYKWRRADFDRRHRFLLLGRLSLVKAIDVGVGLTMNSGAPYTVTLGDDVYHNGRGRARPAGIGRNTLKGAGSVTLDLRASRSFKFGTGKDLRTVTLGLDAFNLLNRINYGTYVGTLSSPLFGLPVSARSPRQIQCSARLRF